MDDKMIPVNTLDCKEIVSLNGQLQSSPEEQDKDRRENLPSAICVPRTSSRQLGASINSRIKDCNDRIYKEKLAIKVILQSIEDDKTRTKFLMESNNQMKEEIRLNSIYRDRIKSLSDRLLHSNLTIGNYLVLLKVKVKVNETKSAKFGGQLQGHLDNMKQKWETVSKKYNSNPQLRHIISLRKSLHEMDQSFASKEQQAKKLKKKLQEIENYKEYGFKSYNEIIIKIALIKLETLNMEKEINVMHNQTKHVEKMQVDELESQAIPENTAETNTKEVIALYDNPVSVIAEDDITDITDRTPEKNNYFNQDIPMKNLDEETVFSSQASKKSLPLSQTEIQSRLLSVTASTKAIFTPPNTQTIVSSATPQAFPGATDNGTPSSSFKTPSAHPVSPAIFCIPEVNQTSTVPAKVLTPNFGLPSTIPTNQTQSTIAVSKSQPSMSIDLVSQTTVTSRAQPTVPGFSLNTFLKPNTSFNLGLSNTDSPFSAFRSFANEEIPKASANDVTKNASSCEGSAFLFQQETPKAKQSMSFFGNDRHDGPNDCFNFELNASTHQNTSQYFSTDFLKTQATQGEMFGQSIFVAGNQRNIEDSNKTVNQGFNSHFNFF